MVWIGLLLILLLPLFIIFAIPFTLGDCSSKKMLRDYDKYPLDFSSYQEDCKQ